MKRLSLALLGCFVPISGGATDQQTLFADQTHYEMVYEYSYQSNFVERMIFECTADRKVWRKFGYVMAGISNAYTRLVLGTSVFQRDPFTNQRATSRLWQELLLHHMRSPAARGDPADPVLMAQRDVLRLVELYPDDLDALCDFIFWEEVSNLQQIVARFLSDAEERLDEAAFADFKDRTEDGLLLLQRLFAANPLSLGE